MDWLRRRAMVVALLMAGLAAVLLIASYVAPSAICEPVFPSPNLRHGLDLSYLKAHNHHTPGSIALDSAPVKSLFISRDPRNFAVEVSVGEYSTAFGLPATDAQNIFYGHDPAYRNDPLRRVVLGFSRGEFDWKFAGDTAASGPGTLHWPYRVGMGAVDAQTGRLIVDQTPACK
jgi:hypothetical protein